MISYDNYKNRIEKLAKAKRILHKFRFLICGVLALIVGATVGLMCAKGAYTSDMSLSAQTVVFNEFYEVTAAKAFLSSPSEQRVEYRNVENGDWTNEKPVKAGKYAARTVTKKLVGYSYSPEVQFEIIPLAAEFSITGNSVVYGEVPGYSLPQLVSGHRVDESSLQFTYKTYGAPMTVVGVVTDSIKIVDNSGEDFTCCYDFTAVGKMLNINKRDITVTPESYEFTYDAQPHNSDGGVSEETINRLVKGDELAVTTAVSGNGGSVLAGGAVDAGDYVVSLQSVGITHGGEDISRWYNIRWDTAPFKINARKYTLTTGDKIKVYDGEPAVNTDGFTCGNLVEGHSPSIDGSTLPDNPNVNTYPNVFGITVCDESGADVTRNYELDRENSHFGTLTISPAKLTVTTGSWEVTYNGRPWTSYNFGYSERLDYKFSVSYVKNSDAFERENFTDAGTHKNIFAVEVTLNGEPVTDNFDIEYVYGDIVIAKRNITVTTGSDAKVYDGVAFACDNPVENGKVPEHSLSVSQPFSATNVTGEKGVKNDIKYTVFDEYGRDVGKNYAIEHISGTLIIEPLQISVKTADASREYDGTPFSNADYIATRINAYGTGLCGSDALFPIAVTSRTEAGSQDNVCRYELPTYDGVHTNYELVGDITYGTLTVEPKNVSVYINSAAFVYGADIIIPANDFVLSCTQLPNDEILTFTTHFENAAGETCAPEKWQGYTLLDAGAYAILPNDDLKITGGNANLKNYAFDFGEGGALTISARRIIVTTATDTKIYDGKPLENDGYTTVWADDNTKLGLLNGAELIKDTNNTVVNPPVAGPYPNVCNYKVPNGNYEIYETKYGTLTITPRPIIVYTEDGEKTYDGTQLTNTAYTTKYAVQIDGEWVADETKPGLISREDLAGLPDLLTPVSVSSLTDAGTTENKNAYVNANYDIKDYVYGTLKVNKFKAELDLGTQISPYGYHNIEEGETEYLAGVLTNNELLVVTYKFKQGDGFVTLKDVGKYTTVAQSYQIFSSTFAPLKDGVNNYEITCHDGGYEILPRAVEVQIGDGTAVYGDSVSAKTYGLTLIDPAELPYGEQLTITYKYDREVKDVGGYDIFENEIFIDGKKVDPEKCNYAFTFNKGTLTVTKKMLIVYLDNYGKAEEIYYGTPWSYRTGAGNYAKTEGLVAGEQLEILVRLDGNSRYNPETGKYEPVVGSYSTDMTGGKIYVNGVEKENGLNNYSCGWVKGYLNVLKKNIEVTFVGDSIVYGETAEGKTYNYSVTDGLDEQGSLPYGEILTIDGFIYKQGEETVTPKNAGEYAIEGETVLINGSTDGASNYAIIYKGKLTVDKKVIDIKLKDITCTYGDVYPFYTGGLYGGHFYVFKDSGEFDYLEYDEFLNVKFEFSKDGEEGVTPRDFGEYAMNAAELRIAGNSEVGDPENGDFENGVKQDGKFVFANYIINCEGGTLKIDARPITITVRDREITYGETVDFTSPLFESVTNVNYDEEGNYQFPYGDNFVVGFLIDGERASNTKLYAAGEHEITVRTWGVMNAGKQVPNENYDVTWIPGTLTVKPKTLSLVISNKDDIYYGDTITYNGYTVYDGENEYTFADGESLSVSLSYYKGENKGIKPINADTYGVTVSSVKFNGVEAVLSEEGYAAGNYLIKVTDGTLTIKPKEVTVVLSELEQIYYGDTFKYADGIGNYASATELAYNEKLEVAVEYLIDGEVGTPKNANYDTFRDRYRYAYSARLNRSGSKIYKSNGVTEIENGVSNYAFVCEDLENLKILRRAAYVYVDDVNAVYGEFGRTVTYPGGIHNYKKVEYKDGENFVEGLPYGEQFSISVEYYDGEKWVLEQDAQHIKNRGEYAIRLFTIKVYDKGGNPIEDGAENYSYATAAKWQGKLTISPKDIRIALNSYKIEYGDFKNEEGGTFVYPDNVDNYDLDNSTAPAFDEKFKVQIKYQQNGANVTPKNVGSYVIAGTDFTVYDGNKTADKNNYNFVGYTAGTLEITQKRVEVAISLIHESTYGEALPEVKYYMTDKIGAGLETLPYGDMFGADFGYYLSADKDKTLITPRNAGEYKITVKTAYINEVETAFQSSTGNYYLVLIEGLLTINKADLRVDLIKGSICLAVYGDYRGYPSGKGNYRQFTSGIMLNDELELAVLYEVRYDNYNTGLVEVGNVSTEIPKNAAIYNILLDEENSLIHTVEGDTYKLGLNYNVECGQGLQSSLTIWQRYVTVEYSFPEYTYGQRVEKPKITIKVLTIPEYDQSEISTIELPYGETCDFDFEYEDENGNKVSEPKNAGTYKVRIAKKYVNGREDLAKNYDFNVDIDGNDYATLTINKKAVEITLDDMTKTYGYFEFAKPETHTFTATDGDLQYTDELSVKIDFTAFGDPDKTNYITPKAVDYYSIVAKEFAVTYFDGTKEASADGNALKNYKINCNGSVLKIDQLPLYIALSRTAEITYGEPVPEVIPYTVTSDGKVIERLPYDDNLAVASYYEPAQPKNAGEYAVVYDGAAINLSYDDPNYIIKGENGLLTIKQRELTVTVTGGKGTYGYETLPEIGFEVTEGETLSGEKLVPAFVFSLNGEPCDPVNAGTYDIAVDEENSTVEGGNARYENYRVTYVYEGKLIIDPSPLTVKINGDSFTYGERSANVTHEITAGKLYHGDSLELTYYYDGFEEEPTAAGTYAITATAAITGGNASVGNYTIEYVENDPTLTIEKRGIEIKLNAGNVTAFAYGTPYSGDICNAEIIGAAAGENVTVAVTYAKVPSALRARAIAAREGEEAEAFIPRDAGLYTATLDFENCTVTDIDGNLVDGGIENYKLSADCKSVEFEITPMELTVNVSDAQITYGDKLPAALGYNVTEEMPYGESLELTFSFAGDDGKLPVHKGDYKAKITDKTVNGGQISNYRLNFTNDEPKLTINPKTVKIRLSNLGVSFGTQVVYPADSYNKRSSDSLIEGDVLTVTSVKYIGADGTEYTAANGPVNAGEYDIIFLGYSIVNADGEDATEDYSVTKQNSVLMISRNIIIIYTASAEKEYDGTALTCDRYDRYEGELLGYTIVADDENIFSQTDVTDANGVDNTTEFKIVDENGIETHNFEILYGADNNTYGKLKVTPRPIEIKSEGAEKEYDGTALKAGYEVIYKGVYAGAAPITACDRFTVTRTGEQIDAGESENIVYYTLTNSGNYKITTNFGTLKVNPKYVEVTIDKISAVYGELPAITFNTDAPLAAGETLTFGVEYRNNGATVTPETIDGHFIMPAGRYRMYYADGTAAIDGGRGLVSNYDLEFVPAAELTVTPRRIAITTATDEAEYSGSAFYNFKDYTTEWVVDGERKGETGLIGADTLDVLEGYAKQTAVGSCENKCLYSVSDNYVIEAGMYVYGTLTVTERTVTVKTADINEEYNGEAHSDGVPVDVNNKLVAGHWFKVESDIVAPVDVTGGDRNELTVSIKDADGNDVTSQYKIKYDYGTIVIRQRPLKITTGGVSGVEYDGEAHGNNAYTAADGLLEELGHELVVDYEFKYANATAGVDNETTYFVFGGGKDLTRNYAITYAYGSIKIDRKSVDVNLNENVKVQYGGNYTQPLTRGAVTLVNGETVNLAVTVDREVSGIGSYTAEVNWSGSVIRDSSGKIIVNGANNYSPVLQPVVFEVIPREISVTLNAGGKTKFVYGENYDTAIRTVTVDSMVGRERLNVAVNYLKEGEIGFVTPQYVGNYTAQIDESGCTVSGGSIANYNIVLCSDANFEIVAKDLTVYTADITVKYDRTPAYLDGESGYTKVEGLVGDDDIKVIPAFEKNGERVTEFYAGTYDIVCGGIIVSGGAVSADNYNVITGTPYGTLTVTGIGIVVVRKTVTKTYDGEPLALGYEAPETEVSYVINGDESLKLPDGNKLVLDGAFATADGNVSSSCANTARYKVIGEAAGNYVVTYADNGARLEIEALPFTVEISDETMVFGEVTGAGTAHESALIGSQKLNFYVEYAKDGVSCAADKLLDCGEYEICGVMLNMSVIGGKIDNYDITFKEGAKLTVNKRQIIVTTATAEAEYSGEPFSKPDGYTTEWIKDGVKQGVSGLLNGDELTIVTSAAQTELGSCVNACTYTAPGNYEIADYVNGTLTVKKIAITVTTNEINGGYRGTAYSDGGFKYDDKLLAGHTLTVSGDIPEFLDATVSGKNVFAVTVTAGGADVSGYYAITYEYGDVVITKRALTVILNGEKTEFVYGDDTFDGLFKQATASGLVGGDTLTTVALIYNTSDGSMPVNAGSYTARLDIANSFIAYAGEGNGIGNYDITCEALDFVISGKPVTLSLGNWAAEEYDGEAHVYDTTKLTVTGGELVGGDVLANIAVRYCTDIKGLNAVSEIKGVGTYYVFLDLDKTTVSGAGGETAISANYVVTCPYITFTVTAKSFIITLSDVSHVYDGTAYDFASGDGFTTTLCGGDSIKCKVTYDGDPVNAGTYNVKFSEDIEFISGNADNYRLDTENSKLECTLTITEREITVTVADRNVERGEEEYAKADITSVAAGGGAGFVAGDLEKATVTFRYFDGDGNELSGVPSALGEYTVSVELGGEVMKNYKVAEINAGTLTVTERKVLVTPVYVGEKSLVYDGGAFSSDMFDFTHVHNVAGGAGELGFTEADAARFKENAVYAFKDLNGNTLDTPVNAGIYVVSVRLSGDGIGSYEVEYEDLLFYIAKRPLAYTVEVEGAAQYVYSNSKPDFTAKLADGYTGFVNGELPEHTFELFSEGKPVTRYDVGTYTVMMKFAGMENYSVTATTAQIEIIRRTIVVTPSDPFGGVAQTYNGSDLTLGAYDREIASKSLENGDLAVGDDLKITSTSFAPTSVSGTLKISGVTITGDGKDVSDNYTVYYEYNAVNQTIKALGLRSYNFQVRVSYAQTKINYTLGDVGTSLPYTGKTAAYTFDKDGAVSLSEGETLGFGHYLDVSQNSVTVPAAAGEYADLITKLVRVFDGGGRNVTAIYILECDNPENGVIKVTENVLSADLSGLTVDMLEVGKLEVAVSGLFGGANPAHQAEVQAFNLDGKWLIGITVFSETGAGRKTDLSENYKLDENCKLDGATVKIITLAEADEYSRDAIGVEITVSESELNGGRESGLYTFDGESRWVLQSGYTVSGGEYLEKNGHKLQVLVFKENGNYLLGVTVYSEANGRRSDASGNYRLKDLVKSDVAARYITVSEEAKLQREIFIDFSGAQADENGLVTGYTVVGLNAVDKHNVEVTVGEDGGYEVAVYALSSGRKLNKYATYDLVYTAPAGVTAELKSGNLN